MKLAGATLVGALMLGLCVSAVHEAVPKEAREQGPPIPQLRQDALAEFVSAHCAECHGPKEPEAALDLASSARPEAQEVLGRMWRQMKDGHMPPADNATDGARIRAEGLAILKPLLLGAENMRSPAARRLSREETRRSLRAIFGIDLPADVLPEDELAHGFDNVANLRTFGPQVSEQLVAAAEHAAMLILPPGLAGDIPQKSFAADEMSCDREHGAEGTTLVLYMNATLTQPFTAVATGRHRLIVRASAQQAGTEPARMEIRVDGRHVATHSVRATRSRPEEYSCEVDLRTGAHTFTISFTNDHYVAPSGGHRGEDRNLHVEHATLAGPFLDATHEPSQRILVRDPGAGRQADERVHAMLEGPLRRLWGREDNAARKAIVKLVTGRLSAGDPLPVAMRIGLAAAMASPRFWQCPETAEPDGPALARRLALFLWSSVADEDLLAAATRGDLSTVAGLHAQTLRMLADPRSSALAESFVPRWLEFANLAVAAPDPMRFPAFTPELRRSMAEEPRAFFELVRRRSLPVSELVAANWSCIDDALAAHYGVVAPHEAFGAIELPGRGGLLGMAAMLTITSNPGRTSPVKRGKWILDHLLDAPPPPPPANVGVLDERPEILESLPIRDRLAQHSKNALCASCHQRLDPLGFALEHFDAIGAWRKRDGPHAVDTAGSLPDGRPVNGLEGVKRIVAADRTLERGLLRALFTTALGRGLGHSDECFLDVTLDGLPHFPTIDDLILAVVTSPLFRHKVR